MPFSLVPKLAVALIGAVLIAPVAGNVIDLSPPADEQLARAQRLVEQGKRAEARALLEELLKQRPSAASARLLLGTIYLDDKPPAARAAALAVLESGVRNDEALNLLTVAYSRTRATGLARADEARLRELEIADYLKILERHPDWGDVLYRSASQRLALERLLPADDLERRDAMLTAAMAELTRLVGMLRTDGPTIERASALYQLGRALKHAADFLGERGQAPERRALLYDRALTAFERAFEIDSGRVDAVGEIVLVELARLDPGAAVRAVETRIHLASTERARAKLYSVLGNLYLQTGRTDEALSAFNSVLEIGAGPMDTYLGLYRIHYARADLTRAQEAMRAAVTAQPAFVMGHLKLGELSAARGRYTAATSHFEQALAVPPGNAVVLGMIPSRNVYRNGLYYQAAAWLAWLYLEHGKDPRRALQAVEAAERFGAIDPRLADTRGWIYFHLRDYLRARALLEAVAAGAGDFPAVHYHLARTYAALGDKAAARRAVRRALNFSENFTDRAAAEALSHELD